MVMVRNSARGVVGWLEGYSSREGWEGLGGVGRVGDAWKSTHCKFK